MENYLWQKALLNLYPRLHAISIATDKEFDRKVAGSCSRFNSEYLFDEIFDLLIKKNNCKLAKAIMDKAFKKLEEENKKVLLLRYADNLSFKDIAKRENVNIRQVFRNFNKELAYFSFLMSKDGFDSLMIEKEFQNDTLFYSAYIKELEKFNNKSESFFKTHLHYNDGRAKSTRQIIFEGENSFY